jgi:hypothetical protein
LELEQWITLRTQRTSAGEVQQGNYTLWEFREELEYGVTDNYSVSLYINTAAESFRDFSQDPPTDRSEFNFKGVSIENRYMVWNPADHAVGLTLPNTVDASSSAQGRVHTVALRNVVEELTGVSVLPNDSAEGRQACDSRLQTGAPNLAFPPAAGSPMNSCRKHRARRPPQQTRNNERSNQRKPLTRSALGPISESQGAAHQSDGDQRRCNPRGSIRQPTQDRPRDVAHHEAWKYRKEPAQGKEDRPGTHVLQNEHRGPEPDEKRQGNEPEAGKRRERIHGERSNSPTPGRCWSH